MITVISPHPDDESLGVGGIIYEARQRDIPVTVIFLTSGDGNRVGTIQHSKQGRPKASRYLEYAGLREVEALAALAQLGVEATMTHFLRLPDQGLRQILRSKHARLPYRSRYTNLIRSPEGLSYTGEAATARLTELLRELAPSTLLFPMLEDTHSDHAAGGELAILASKGMDINKFAYPIHYRLFPKPRGTAPHLPLQAPRRHPRKDWQSIPLSHDAITAKARAIEAYASQLKIPLLGKLMRSLVRRNELLLSLDESTHPFSF